MEFFLLGWGAPTPPPVGKEGFLEKRLRPCFFPTRKTGQGSLFRGPVPVGGEKKVSPLEGVGGFCAQGPHTPLRTIKSWGCPSPLRGLTFVVRSGGAGGSFLPALEGGGAAGPFSSLGGSSPGHPPQFSRVLKSGSFFPFRWEGPLPRWGSKSNSSVFPWTLFGRLEWRVPPLGSWGGQRHALFFPWGNAGFSGVRAFSPLGLVGQLLSLAPSDSGPLFSPLGGNTHGFSYQVPFGRGSFLFPLVFLLVFPHKGLGVFKGFGAISLGQREAIFSPPLFLFWLFGTRGGGTLLSGDPFSQRNLPFFFSFLP